MRGETQITQTCEQSAERRRAIRYRMRTPIIFRWKGPDNVPLQGEGVTRDMNVAGVFVLTATCPPPNAVVQMAVLLPISDGASKMRMKSDMTVLRVEHDIAGKERSGFSAVGKGFSLHANSKRPSDPIADSAEKLEGQK